MRIFVLACVALLSTGSQAAVTYSFDWYCPGCAKIGMASNGREGPFGTGSACDNARASLQANIASRGCEAGTCFNAQPCVTSGLPDQQARPAAIPFTTAPSPLLTQPVYDATPDRVRRAEEVAPLKETPRESISGRWRNSFSWYQLTASKDVVEIDLVETCRTPDCLRREYPNRPVFLGKLDGNRLVGVVPIRHAIESEQNGKRCGTPAGEFQVEGRVSDDRNVIVWRAAQLPAVEGCAPVSISLGTWRRG